MKKLTYTTVLTVLVASAAFGASALAGPASNTVTFKGTYSGKATEKVSGQTVIANAKGSGSGTVLGKSTIRGTVTGTTANPPCSPFGGPGTIAGAKGTLNVKVINARGCAASEDQRNQISLAGTVKVKSGTRKFRKAKGSFHFSGNYNRSSGAFKVKLTGRLTY